MPAGWHSLTPDLAEAILLLLDPEERRTVAPVCSRWNELLRSHHRFLALDLGEAHAAVDAVYDLLSAAAHRRQLNRLQVQVEHAGQYATLAVLVRELPCLQVLEMETLGVQEDLPAAVVLYLPALRNLQLSNPPALPDCLGDLTALTKLKVWFEDPSTVTLPSSFKYLRQLHQLSIAALAIPPPPYRHFTHDTATLVRGLKCLAHLPALRHVKLSSVCAQDVDWLPALTQVTCLQLEALRRFDAAARGDAEPGPFNGQAWEAALHPLTQLVSLDMGSCKLTEVPPSVPRMARLETLSLRNNKDLRSLPEGPYQKALSSLDLNVSPNMELESLLGFLEGARGLTELRLTQVPLQPEPREALRVLLSGLPRLRCIELSKTLDASMVEAIRQRAPPLEVTLGY